jgi:hypothetical protein
MPKKKENMDGTCLGKCPNKNENMDETAKMAS